MAERVQKILANAGHGSRRQIEKLIKEGKITVNGETAVLGQTLEPKDRVAINSKAIRLHLERETKCKVIGYYKPTGQICTRKDEDIREFWHCSPDVGRHLRLRVHL